MTPSKDKIVSLQQLKVACQQCSLREICLPVGVNQDEIEQLDEIIGRKKPLNKGDYLYHIGDKFNSIYAVRSGSLKSFCTTESGEEQITGFHLPGELVGLDAIADNAHPVTARALETTSVCEIPFDKLNDLSGKLIGLRKQILRVMSREIKEDHHNMLLLGQKTAEERLAAMLMSISGRQKIRGFSPNEFFLTMSRGDIGNFLGLALETVSRLFGRFQEEKLIQVNRKYITIIDMEKLTKLAGSHCSRPHDSGVAKG
ncbi:MAG: fumarate/nitrate reduction transcriptional regulator Fnr [Gammaproteobacteria bacterium]